MIEAEGISFLAEGHQQHLVAGLRIEVQRVLGREGLVAFNMGFEPSAC
ncbi:MAG TPA: hypothetical protein VF841_03035 [Anaeromyxobacter sp.]